MDTNKNWLKFIISGRAEDYINFCNSRREQLIGGDTSAYYDRRACDKGKELRRIKPTDNTFNA